MKLINNKDNLSMEDMTEFVNKVRAIIIDKDNNILITKYADIFMLPGGKVNLNETNDIALFRELEEELGINFKKYKIKEFVSYENYLKSYRNVNNKLNNRLNKTDYYIINVDTINDLKINTDKLSLNEKKADFNIEIYNLYELVNKVNNYKSNNIRYDIFKKELVDVIKYLITVKNINVDLHVHTNYSDGDLSPDEVIEYAKKRNIDMIAITDHDTLYGIKNIRNKDNVNIINGIEFSCKVDKGRMHLLGYNIDINNKELNDKINELRDNSLNMLLSLIVQIKIDYNIVFKYDDIKDLINSNHHLGRPDLAKLLLKYGYVSSVQEAFDKYLIDAYDKIRSTNNLLTYAEAINLIINSGGIPVLAHPKSLKLSEKELLVLIKDMIKIGLEGIEVYHSTHTYKDVELYESIAKELGLLISGGSDYHGKLTKPNVEIGLVNNEKIYSKKLSILNKLI